jgi:hypothetical protein
MSQRTIAQVLGFKRKPVQRYLAAATVPARPRHQRQARLLPPDEPYLLARWRQGYHKGLGLWRDGVALGYPGQRATPSRASSPICAAWSALARLCQRHPQRLA